jgi:cytochrome b561
MSPTVRSLLGLLAGCAVAVAIVRLLEQLANQVTMPAGLDPTNLDQVKLALEHGEFPFASLALVLAGWLLAAYVGSRICSSIGRSRTMSLAFTVIFTALTIHDLLVLPHPTWMWIGGALGVPLVALGAAGESITVRGL